MYLFQFFSITGICETQYADEFKIDAVRQVAGRGNSVAEVAFDGLDAVTTDRAPGTVAEHDR